MAVKDRKRTCKNCACNQVCAYIYQSGGFCSKWQPRVTYCINCVNWRSIGGESGWCKAWEGCRMAFHYCGEGVRKIG